MLLGPIEGPLMRTIRLRLLSGFELSIEGEPVDLQPTLQRLVAFVALAPRGVERDYTAFQLWPDSSERCARASLRSALWRLGKLPGEILVCLAGRLHLADGVWVDTRDGIEELAAGGDSEVLLLPFEALDGDLLPDWYDPWLIVERERFRQLRLHVLEERAQVALDCGNTAKAIQAALAAVAIDPHRESSRRLVITAHLAEGNHVEAARAFRRYRTRLRTDTGLEPSTELTSLIESAHVAV